MIAIEVVFLQEGQPMAYESRQLNGNEKTLGIYEKDLLTLIHAMKS